MPDQNTSPRPTPVSPAPKAEDAPPKPRLLEVELLRKYCPHDIVNDDGTVRPNGDPSQPAGQPPTGLMQTIGPGVVRLSAKDANVALRQRIAIPTQNTEFV